MTVTCQNILSVIGTNENMDDLLKKLDQYITPKSKAKIWRLLVNMVKRGEIKQTSTTTYSRISIDTPSE